MKKVVVLIALILLLLAIIYPKSYQTYPGYVAKDDYKEFQESKKRCIGYSVEKTYNYPVPADAPEYNLCFGILY